MAVTHDISVTGNNTSQTTSVTSSISTSAQGLVVLSITLNANTPISVAPTIGGNPAAFLFGYNTISGSVRVEIWVYRAISPISSGSIVVTLPVAQYANFAADAFAGALTIDAYTGIQVPASGTSATPTSSVFTQNANDLVMAVFGYNGPPGVSIASSGYSQGGSIFTNGSTTLTEYANATTASSSSVSASFREVPGIPAGLMLVLSIQPTPAVGSIISNITTISGINSITF